MDDPGAGEARWVGFFRCWMRLTQPLLVLLSATCPGAELLIVLFVDRNKASGMASVSKPVTGEKMDEGDGMALKPTSWQTSWSEDEDEDDEEGGVAVEPVGENGNGGGVIATDVRPGVGVKSYWASDLVFR